MVKRAAGGGGKFVAYYRVSTDKQGRSGLGLEAQREAVRAFLAGKGWPPIAQFVEVESGKREDNRPELEKAMRECRLRGATLVVAKLDRLSRDAEFLLRLQKGAVPFVCADMPDANEMTVGLLAVIAQAERKMISKRTKEALAAYKARCEADKDKKLRPLGTPANLKNGDLGRERASASRSRKARDHAADLAPVIRDLQAAGATSLHDLAEALKARNIPAARGGDWSPTQVQRVLYRLGEAA
jgi:DNA invertase Pin-like site-specific DNA recombinase